MAKEPRHSKMYAETPSIKKDEHGKPKVTKAEKKSDHVAEGTDGMQEMDKKTMELHQKHMKERMDMHHKHEKEHMALMHKTAKEETGAEEIKKTESDKKE